MSRISDYEDFRDFVFYTILKENDQYGDAFTFGVEKGFSRDHAEKFSHFLAKAEEYRKLEHIDKTGDWETICEKIADDGNIIFFHSALEYHDINLVCLLLPSYPTLEQVKVLQYHFHEIEEILMSVRVHGELIASFLEERRKAGDAFQPVSYVKTYMAYHEQRLNKQMGQSDIEKQKVL